MRDQASLAALAGHVDSGASALRPAKDGERSQRQKLHQLQAVGSVLLAAMDLLLTVGRPREAIAGWVNAHDGGE